MATKARTVPRRAAAPRTPKGGKSPRRAAALQPNSPRIGLALAGGGLSAATPRTPKGGKNSRRAAALQPNSPRIGLALAGGGPLGAIYEIGAIAALEESLIGLDFNDLEIYVGVSAGSFIAAGLANGITARDMSQAFIENQNHAGRAEVFDPAILLKPAFAEYWSRMLNLPGLLASATFNYMLRPQSLVASFERLGRALPSGVFSGTGIDKYLTKLFSYSGRTNAFKHLKKRLVIVATDLDSGEPVGFGTPGADNLPISKAVQASAALPGLFPPVEINGRYYLDGALKKTLHASVALNHGVDLLLCLNPLVPYVASAQEPATKTAPKSKRSAKQPESALVQGGLPTILSQTFRSIIHSRMQVGMAGYASRYPQTQIVLFEPDHTDPEIFFSNLFSYAQRRRLCEYAYQRTRRELWERRHEIAPKLAAAGVKIQLDVLTDPKRTLVAGAKAPLEDLPLTGFAAARLQDALDDLDRFLKSTPQP
jgi:NTE family protein